MDELAGLAPEDAFRLSILRSGFAAPVLARRLNWSESFLYRVTSSEKYFPSYEDLPAFCLAVGNTIVVDWLFARMAKISRDNPEVTPGYLREQVLELSEELGQVAGKVKAAVADDHLTKTELRGLLRTVLHVSATVIGLAEALRAAERKVGRHA